MFSVWRLLSYVATVTWLSVYNWGFLSYCPCAARSCSLHLFDPVSSPHSVCVCTYMLGQVCSVFLVWSFHCNCIFPSTHEMKEKLGTLKCIPNSLVWMWNLISAIKKKKKNRCLQHESKAEEKLRRTEAVINRTSHCKCLMIPEKTTQGWLQMSLQSQGHMPSMSPAKVTLL